MSASSFIAAADTTNMQAGGETMLEDIGNVFTKGIGAAVVSGWHGILNTGIDAANYLADAGIERADTAKVLNEVDQSWGDYYNKNKSAIDIAGFVAASFVPGGLAVKGLKLAQTGALGSTFARTVGFASTRETMYLNKALTELAQEGGTVFTRINGAKAASMAWGTADAALQMAAFETATAITMKSSPILENESWKDIAWDVVTSSFYGGMLGGGVNALITNKIVKDAGKAVEAKQRLYDRLADPGLLNLSAGDKAFSIAESILALPKQVLDPVVKLNHARPGVLTELDTKEILTKTLQESVIRGTQKLESELTNIVKTDVTVGKPLAQALVGIVKQGLEQGAPDAALRTRLGDYLHNLVSVEGIGGRSLDLSGDVMWLAKRADITKPLNFGARTLPDDMPYRAVGDISLAKSGTLGKDAMSKEEAWKKGFDVLLDPATRQVEISPFSSIFKKVAPGEADFTPIFLNTKTLQTSDRTVATIGDVSTVPVPITVNAAGVTSGNKAFTFKTSIYNEPADSVEATARHLWAAELPAIRGTVNAEDIAVLEAMRANPGRIADDVEILDQARNATFKLSDIPDFESFVFGKKYDQAIKLLEKQGDKADLQDIAYKLNVERDWMDKAISNQFSSKDMFADPGWTRNALEYKNRENLVLRYDTAAVEKAAMAPDAIVAYHQRIAEATERGKDATRAVLGVDKQSKLLDLGNDAVLSANSQTVGAGIVASSNAGYADKLRSWAQYTGLQTANLVQERVSKALLRLQGDAAVLLQNPKAAAEVSAVVTKLRLSTTSYALHTDALTGTKSIVDLASYRKFQKGGPPMFAERVELSKEAGAFIATHHSLHGERIAHQKVLADAQGVGGRWDPDKLYFPPVDTQRVPFFAFVRQSDGTVFGSTEVAMVTARSAEELAAKAAAIEADKSMNLRVIYKSNTEAYHKAKGDYDFSRTMNEPVIDSMLRSQGKLGDYIPNMTPQAVVEDFVQYTQRAETKIVRDAVTVNHAQTFAELADLSARYTGVQTSKFEGLNKWLKGAVDDPFGDYQKLALNISKRGEFTILHQMNEFVDALGTRGFRMIEGAFGQAKEGKVTWQEANDMLRKVGLGEHFTSKELFEVAQTASDRNIVKVAFQKANMLVATGMLRLDFANSLLNIISTPILLGTEVRAIRSSLKDNPELFAQFNSMLHQKVPGSDVVIPSTTRMIFKAVGELHGPNATKLYERFTEIGTVKGPAAQFHAMMEDLSLVPKLVPNEYAKKVDDWVEKASKITYSTQAEDKTRFVTSHVMMQMTDPLVAAGKMTVQEQNAFITIFTNRVQGNYVASQRPILFQGTLGSAVGLFQTYQFNLFQQLFRHIENKDVKTIATLGALQGTLFGANGLPLFDAINTHIVGSAKINEGHKDAYTFAVEAAGREWGDWMMYGTASAFPLWGDKAPALYTRGDLNPRSVFVIPTSPMDVPAVSASIKAVSAVLGMASQIGSGADVTDALLFGLEHNGLNRPLSGLAQMVKGDATTAQGNLISASSDLLSIANAARLIGAKPLDESIALNTMYRSRAYQAMDKERIDKLGTVIKEKLRGNQTLSTEDFFEFQSKYAASGGNIEGYSRALQRWDKAANTSISNAVMDHNNTAAGRRMNIILGGDELQDYQNTPVQE